MNSNNHNLPAQPFALNNDGTVNMDALNDELKEAGLHGLYPQVTHNRNGGTHNFHSYDEAQQVIENRKAANRHNKASHTQQNDTISDIMNSDEYKQTLDYILANHIGNLPHYQTHDHLGINPDAEQHNIINPLETFTNPESELVSIMDNDIKWSKPVNIATNEPKTEDIDMPAKPIHPNSLPKNVRKTVRPDPQITPASVLDGYIDPMDAHDQALNQALNQVGNNNSDKSAYTSFGEQWEGSWTVEDATPQPVNVLQDKVTPVQDFDNIVSLNTPTNDMPALRSLDIKMLFTPSMPHTDSLEHTESEPERDPDTMKALKEKYKGYRLTASDDDWTSNENLTDEQLAKMLCDNEALLLEIESEQAQAQAQLDIPSHVQSDTDFDEWCESADMVHAVLNKPEIVDVDKPAPQGELSQAVDNNKYDYMFDRQYQITATGRQVDDLSFACETMARIEIGQMNAIIDALPLKGDTDTYALLQQLEHLIKPHLKPNLPHSPFFTMHQSLRHRRSWDIHPEGGMTVNFDEPLILDPKTPLLDIVLLQNELSQDIFKGQPHHILSAHIDENGTAMLNQCFTKELTIHEGKHICLKAGAWQYPVGKGYNTDNWQASPINRVF